MQTFCHVIFGNIYSFQPKRLSSEMWTFYHMIFGHIDDVQMAIKRNVDYSICWKSYISIIALKYVDQLPHREKI
jgi:hypothetical protein